MQHIHKHTPLRCSGQDSQHTIRTASKAPHHGHNAASKSIGRLTAAFDSNFCTPATHAAAAGTPLSTLSSRTGPSTPHCRRPGDSCTRSRLQERHEVPGFQAHSLPQHSAGQNCKSPDRATIGCLPQSKPRCVMTPAAHSPVVPQGPPAHCNQRAPLRHSRREQPPARQTCTPPRLTATTVSTGSAGTCLSCSNEELLVHARLTGVCARANFSHLGTTPGCQVHQRGMQPAYSVYMCAGGPCCTAATRAWHHHRHYQHRNAPINRRLSHTAHRSYTVVHACAARANTTTTLT